jgi:hypothetical protein
MPEPVLILTAMGIAVAASALIFVICGWRWRRAAGPPWLNAGWVLGVGFGLLLGCWALRIRPHWPPSEVIDRLLGLVLPAVLVVELLAVFPKVPRWLVWTLRLALVAGSARVLLQGTSYITDLAGPGTSEWSPPLAWVIFGGLGALEAAVWALLSLLDRRAPGPSVPVCLAVASAGAALTVMFSGSASGGQVGLPLAAAIVGSTTAMLVLTRSSRGTGPLGVPIIGLFSLLVMGRFFGELPSAFALLLFCAPLLGWLPELPYVNRLPSWARGLARVLLVGALVSALVVLAQRKFDRDFQSPSGAAGTEEPSVQDYLIFGK